MKTKAEFLQHCRANGACDEGLAWVESQQVETAQEIWDRFERPDWMLWFARRSPQGIDKRTAVQLAVVFARSVVQFVPKGEGRPLAAIEAAEGWLAGTAPLAQVRAMRLQAWNAHYELRQAAAAAVSAVAAAAAADTAAAAAAAADTAAAAVADADAAAAAAVSAVAAAAAAVRAHSHNDARAEIRREFCNVIRKAIKEVPSW